MSKIDNREYVIPIKGMSQGRHKFDLAIGDKFFEEFESSEILGASLSVELTLEKSTTLINISGKIKGIVKVECDRCLEMVDLEIEAEPVMIVKFVKSTDEPEDSEVLTLDMTESELDLTQFLYDYICLALPIQRVHKEGECDKEMLKKLGKYSNAGSNDESNNSPFEKLKDLLN